MDLEISRDNCVSNEMHYENPTNIRCTFVTVSKKQSKVYPPLCSTLALTLDARLNKVHVNFIQEQLIHWKHGANLYGINNVSIIKSTTFQRVIGHGAMLMGYLCFCNVFFVEYIGL